MTNNFVGGVIIAVYWLSTRWLLQENFDVRIGWLRIE
jgi:hypothetical protein